MCRWAVSALNLLFVRNSQQVWYQFVLNMAQTENQPSPNGSTLSGVPSSYPTVTVSMATPSPVLTNHQDSTSLATVVHNSPIQTPGIHINVIQSKPKHVKEAYILAIPPLGWFGAHHFYLRRPSWGVLYMITLGLFMLGWLFDLLRMPCLVKRMNRKIKMGEVNSADRNLSDAYSVWFPPCGLLGRLDHLHYCMYLYHAHLLAQVSCMPCISFYWRHIVTTVNIYHYIYDGICITIRIYGGIWWHLYYNKDLWWYMMASVLQ